MGILDFLDDPNTLRSLFGGGASPEQMSPLPPGGGIGSDSGRVPNQPQMMPMPPQRPQMAMPMPPPDPRMTPVPMPESSPSMLEAPGGVAAPHPLAMPPPVRAGMGPGGGDNFGQRFAAATPELPTWRPSGDEAGMQPEKNTFAERFDAAKPELPTWRPSGDEAGMIAADPARVAKAQGPMPPPLPGGQVPPGRPRDAGLAGSFGLVNQTPEQQSANTWRAALGGVGKGLSAVGRQPAGTTKGAAFAAGAGGALEGTTENLEKQKNTLFEQTSTAFRNMLADEGMGNATARTEATMEYLKARAKSIEMLTKAGKISGAYQNSPEFKVLRVEQEADRWYDNREKRLREEWKADGANKAQRDADTAALKKEYEIKRNELYKRTGIDPANAEKIKTMGTSPKNPFDTRGMSRIEFEARVPKDGYYLNKDGKLFQRGDAPSHDPRTQAPPQPNALASTQEDRDAMAEDAA